MDTFQQEVERRLATAHERLNSEQARNALEMAVLSTRYEAYAELADRLIEENLLPRVSTLASQFENAQLSHVDGQYMVGCEFRHSTRFPATVKLSIGVSHDERVEDVVAYYELSILPIFMKFQKHVQATWKLDEFNATEFTSWVESQLLVFLETYLRIEEVDQYQQESLCTDPVCGMRIRKSTAVSSVEYGGKTFYFCVDECRKTFQSDPSRYVGH